MIFPILYVTHDIWEDTVGCQAAMKAEKSEVLEDVVPLADLVSMCCSIEKEGQCYAINYSLFGLFVSFLSTVELSWTIQIFLFAVDNSVMFNNNNWSNLSNFL